MSIRRRQEPIPFPFDLPTANPELRMAATSKIWGYAMGMLGISIPLAAITESAAIPIVVVLMAGCSTIAIWINPANSSSIALDQEKVKQLEERLANLETIVSYEEPMLRSKIENLRSFTD